MSRPKPYQCVVLIEHNAYSVRASRVGFGPLINLWIHETGKGGKGMFLDIEQATDLIEGLNDLLDDIEGLDT